MARKRDGMRAAVLHEAGTPLRIEDLTLDDPRYGEVRVRLEAVGVCHSDYHYMVGDLPCPTPIVLGHEGAGIVVSVGLTACPVALLSASRVVPLPRKAPCSVARQGCASTTVPCIISSVSRVSRRNAS